MSQINQSLRTIFNEAVEIADARQRSEYLAQACGDNTVLRERIEELIVANNEAGRFLGNVGHADGLATQDHPPGGTALLAAITEKPGDCIGRYKLLQKIGEGGCGVVYMAEQEEPIRRRVALKVIKLGMDTRSVIARFEAERQALALMEHPNIAKVHDAGSTKMGRPYFVMELVKGVRITDYCDQNNLPTAARLDLFMQVCHAIQHAHQKGIIHRDIKPSNILVTMHDGVPVPKVIDFGIAKATDQKLTDKTVFTEFQAFIGTPAYMSPEQAEMSGLDIDTRSDIYALGVLLYELLTGKTPFDGRELLASGLDAMRRTIREQEPARPSTRLSTMLVSDLTAVASQRRIEPAKLASLLRGDLDWIVMKALEKDRTRRYDTANGLAMDVARHLNNEPVVARPPGNLYRFQKMVQRNRLGFAAIGAVTGVLVIGAVVSAWLAIRATQAERLQIRLRGDAEKARQGEAAQRQQAEEARANEVRMRHQAEAQEIASRQGAYASDMIVTAHALDDGNFGLARKLLDGHEPRTGQEDLRGFEWRYLRGLSQGDQQQILLGHSNRVNSVAYSPDGMILASGSSDRTVKLWNPKTGELVATCAGHNGEVISVAFSADGRLMASGGEDGLVLLWDIPTRQIVSAISNRSPHVVFSKHLIAIGTGGDRYAMNGGSVKLWDYVAKREVRSLPESGNRAAFSPDGKTLATANWKGLVKLWDLATGQQIRTFSNSWVRTLAFSTNGTRMAWCAGHGEVYLWDFSEKPPLLLLGGPNDNVFDLAFSPDGLTLATANQTHAINLWNVADGKMVDRLQGHAKAPLALAISPDGKTLASGGGDAAVMLWTLDRRRKLAGVTNAIIDPWHWVGHPVCSADGRFLAIASSENEIQLWETVSRRITSRLATTDVPVAFSPNGNELLTRSHSFGSLNQWDLTKQRIHGTTAFEVLGTSSYYADALSPDREIVATAQSDHRIVLHSAITGKVLTALPDASLSRALLFSPDSRMLAAGTFRNTANLWDWATGRVIWTVTGFKDIVDALAFSPDGKFFAAASFDGEIKVCDLTERKELTSLSGHKTAVKRIAFARDGKTLASASDDCTVRLWNLATFREVITFKTDVSANFLEFLRDGNTLAAGGEDGLVHLWRAPSFAEIEAQERSRTGR